MTALDAERLHAPGTPGYRRLNQAMLLAGLAAFGLLYATQPVLPEIGDSFDVGAGTASLAVSATTGALAVAVVPAAAVALRLGRVRVMRSGLVLASVLTALAGLSPRFGVLIGLRAVTGVVLAGVVAVAMGHVGAEVHPRGLASAMGLYVAGNSLGGVGGRLVASFVGDAASWRWGIVAVAGAALVVTALFWWRLPEPVGVTSVPEPGRHAFGELLRRPGMLALLGVPLLLMGAFVAVYNYLGYRLVAPPFSLPLALVGLVFLAYLVGGAASALAGRLADTVGRPPVLLLAVVVMAAGLALTLPDSTPWVVAGVVVFTGGFFGAHGTASGWAPVVAAPFGTQGSALYVCAYYAGSSIFGTVLGTAWSGGGWPLLALADGVLIALGLVAALLVSPDVIRRGRPRDHDV
ncbi:MFS transporter [Nocardioides mangrovicus]|uniref:MFS transporter n=1 Tax=Nocardioides mangrovicus TaxID=2478913 RepID=A0A3L8P1E3_9ACTN|nr:MFS transporter [Nocardioides mangrovicus]RLV48974.1 MFS transporter [Nocardioides mangrovicus]